MGYLPLRSPEEFAIESDWQRLEKMGVTRECMAIAMMLINIAPSADYMLKQYVGNKQRREKKVEVLLSPISVLEEIAQIAEGIYKDTAPEEFLKTWGYPPPRSIIKGLQAWADFLLMGDKFFDAIEANSVLEIAKYGLAGVVKRVTARFHDREVSALTGAALQMTDCDETAHRVWRIRNYGRLEQGVVRFLPVILQALNVVLLPSDRISP